MWSKMSAIIYGCNILLTAQILDEKINHAAHG